MIRLFILLFAHIVLLGAWNKKSEKDKTAIAPAQAPQQPATLEADKANQEKDIQSITAFIDELYNLTTKAPLKSTDLTKLKESDKHGLLSLDLTSAKEYFRYRSFEFLVFNDSLKALDGFSYIVRTSNSEQFYDISTGEENTFFTLFSKSGSTFIRYKHMLIQHVRRCNYNERVETPREIAFVNFLYNNQLPKNDLYFLRRRCGFAPEEWDEVLEE